MKIKAASADQLHQLYVFVVLAVLTCAAAIVAMFGSIWALDPGRRDGLLPILLLVATTALAWTTGWLALTLIRQQRQLPLRRRFRLVGLVSEAAFWAFIGVILICGFVGAYVLQNLRQPQYVQLATFWRAADLNDGVSILVPICLLFTAIYVWCTWNMRRLKMQIYGRTESVVFLDLLTGRDPAVKPEGGQRRGSFRRRLRWTMSEIASWDRLATPWWAAPVGLCALLLFFAPNRFTTVDGLAASWLLWWCSVCGLVLGADAMARSADQGFVLLEALRRLKSHPVSPAFARVAAKPLDWKLRLSPLRRLSLAPLIADMRMLESRFATLTPFEKIAFPDLKDKGSVGDWDSAAPIQATEQWAAVTRGVETLYALLARRQWTFAARAERSAGEPSWPVLDAAEDVVAYCTAFILRNLLARVIAGLTAGLLMIGLVGAAHLLYPFQGRHFWLTVDLTAFLVAAGIACLILLRFERDPILSTLWEKVPGRINWTSGFVYRIAITAAIPAFLVISSFFPEVAGSLASMIEPLQKALP